MGVSRGVCYESSLAGAGADLQVLLVALMFPLEWGMPGFLPMAVCGTVRGMV